MSAAPTRCAFQRATGMVPISIFFFQAGDGIRDLCVTGVQTCALPILSGIERRVSSETPRRGPSTWGERRIRLGDLHRARPAENSASAAWRRPVSHPDERRYLDRKSVV